MFDSCKEAWRRISGVFLTVVSVLSKVVGWLLKSLFGQWQPPFWLRAIGAGLTTLGHKARAYPRQTTGGVLGLLLVVAAAFYGWHWYSNLPKPHTVA